MPNFILLVRASTLSERPDPNPPTEVLGEMLAYNASLVDAGILISGEGLQPSCKGAARLSYAPSGKIEDITVAPGPFAVETLISGYWVIKAKDLEEAIGWAKKIPFTGPNATVEVRTINNWSEDFGGQMTPELKKKEAELRKRIEKH